MKEKKLQVFVSSTYTDLIEERQAAVEAILSAGHIPAGMELFTAGDESQMAVIKRWIDESDVYLLILGGRYGSIENTTGKSYTHLEYEYAVAQGKAMFSVVIKPEALDMKAKLIGLAATDSNGKELNAFRDEVTSKLVKFWEDKKDIKLAIHETLSDFAYRDGLIGWIRGDQGVNGGLLAEEMARLNKENAELRNQLSQIPLNAKPLYAGFTFEQMQKMLSKHQFSDEGQTKNLFDFLMTNGKNLINGYMPKNRDALKLLNEYRLVTSNYVAGGFLRYFFTEDGHLFYLKSLHKLE